MQKYILKQQFEGFSVSNSEGLHKGYDRFQSLLSQLEIHGAGVSTEDANQMFLRSLPSSWSKVSLIMRTKPGVDTLSFDDLYNNLRVFESDVKGSTASSSSTQNVAFVSSDIPNSTNEVSTAYGVSTSSSHNSQKEGSSSYTDDLMYSLFANQSSAPQLDHDDLEQVDEFDLEEMDLKWQVAMISTRLKKFYKKRKLHFDAKEPVGFDKSVDWTGHAENDTKDYALMVFNSSNSGSDTKDKSGFGYESQIHKGVLSYENKIFKSVFDSKSSDVEDSLVNDRIDESKFTFGPKKSTTSKSDTKASDLDYCASNSSVETLETVPKLDVSKPTVVSKPKVWSDAPIIEEYELDSDDEHVTIPSKELEKPSFAFVNTVEHAKTPRETVKEQTTCSKNPKPNKRDWNGLMSKRMALGYGFSKKACFVCDSFSHLIRDCDFHEKRMAKHIELTKQHGKSTGPRENRPVWNNVQRINHQNKFVPTTVLTKTGRFLVNAARQNFTSQAASTSTARKVNTARHKVNETRPRHNVYKYHSLIRRPFNRTTAPKANFTNNKINTAGENSDNPHQNLKRKGIVDSGCSRHVIGNKSYLVDYQDFNGGLVAFGGSKGQINDSFLPNTFWAEAVSTACYVFNRVLVTKPQNKTPCEFLTGKIPIISYIRPFGCHVTILNTIDHLGKFEEKSDERFLVGYSLSSKAFRVYNLETKRVEKNLHINFLENKPNVAGKGPTWLFDLDYLTDLINYQPITAENKANKTAGPKEANHSVGIQDSFYARNSKMETEHAQEYYVLPLWSFYTSTVKSSKPKNGDEKLHADENEANDAAETLRKSFAQSTEDFLLRAGAARASSTNFGHRQEEGIDYDEVFAPVAKIEAIRIFLAFSSYMGFTVYQMVVKSAFLYGKIDGKDKYVVEILKKFDFLSVKTSSTPTETKKPLVKDEEATDVDVHLYRSMIGSLMYLTASRHDIMYVVCACSRFHVTLKTLHLQAVQRIFRYLKGQPKLGLGYPRESTFDLEAYLDSDYARVNLDRKSTTRGCQFLGRILISWQCKKQTIITTSTTEADKELASPKQTALGKDLSNPLMAGSLPKTTLPAKLLKVNAARLKLTTARVYAAEAKVKMVNDEFRIQALVDGKRINIKEYSIRRTLSAKTTSWNEFSSTMASAIICLASSQKFNFSRLPSPSNDPLPSGEDSLKLKELMDSCTNLSNKVLDLESEVIDIKTTYQEMIEKLEGRVERLEDKNRVLKELKNVHSTVDVDDLMLNDEEPAKVEKVLEVVKAAKLMTEVVTTAGATKINIPRRRKGIIIQDPKEITTTTTVQSKVQAKEKGKDILIEEPKPLKRQAQIELDEERKHVTQVQARRNMIVYLKNMAGFKMDYFKRMIYDEIRTIFEKHYNLNKAFLEKENEGVKVPKTKVMKEKDAEVESSKRKGENLEQESEKKQKIEEKTKELRRDFQIVPDDDDDVYTDATPLASKIPITDYKIHTERNNPYFKIIRADGNQMLFISLSIMLKKFDREDLESLWITVRDRFEKTKPKNYSDDYLLNTLKIMFEKPNVEASVWKDQKGRYGLANKSWKLIESCGVHCITFSTTHMFLLVEMIYPLTHFTLEQMLNDVRLQVEEENEMSLELLRLVKRQVNEGFEGSSDTKENRIMDLKLKYQTFKAKPTKSLSQTYTRYKTLLNELANDGVNLSKHEINVGFMNSLSEKWSTFSQGLRNANHTQTLDLADIYERFVYEDNLIQIRLVENQIDVKVKQIRTNNGTEFKNSELVSFCDEKTISQNFSSLYTPEQNGVAERKNITLIEAARTMLNDSDHLGKFDAKADDGYFLGYSFNSEAFRVFNTRRKQIEETYHVTFDVNMEAISFTNTLADETGIDDSSRYPFDVYHHEDDPSRQYQSNSDISYYIIPYGRSLTELTQEKYAPEVIAPNEQNNPYNEVVETLLDITNTEGIQEQNDRWSIDQHIKHVNIIGNPDEGMLTISMATKLTAASASECLFADFLSEIEFKKAPNGYSGTRKMSMVQPPKIKQDWLHKPHGFESSEFSDYVCKLDKALYGQKQAIKAWEYPVNRMHWSFPRIRHTYPSQCCVSTERSLVLIGSRPPGSICRYVFFLLLFSARLPLLLVSFLQVCSLFCPSFLLVVRLLSIRILTVSLEESDDLNLLDAAPVDLVLEACSLPKFDMHLYKCSLAETHVKYLVKLYEIPKDLHPRVVSEGMTMNVLPYDAIGLYAYQYQQGGIDIWGIDHSIGNTNRALKRILEKNVKDNPAIWSRKLDDALWAFRTAYKTPTGTTPYKLIYGKNCHLPFEIEHRAYWALKNCNPDLIATSEKRMFQLHELVELKHQAYENSRLYKARTEFWHNRKLRMGKEDYNNQREAVTLFFPKE
nr:retrovirus-related Pol polyprotein from transposon TNT 1-94 [Tanacetum cinerariifolium]